MWRTRALKYARFCSLIYAKFVMLSYEIEKIVPSTTAFQKDGRKLTTTNAVFINTPRKFFF